MTLKNIDLGELLNRVFRDWAEKAGSEDVEIEFEQTDQRVRLGFDRLKLKMAIDGLLE